jgi:hypothetical protein
MDHVLSASNYTAAIYGTYFNDNHQYGGGFMFMYNINDYISAGLGSDYAGQWRMFSGTVNVHCTKPINDKLSFTGYGIVAAGTSVGGAGSDNGSLATGEGGGIYGSYKFSDTFSLHLGGGYIQRQNCGTYSGGSEMVTLAFNLHI